MTLFIIIIVVFIAIGIFALPLFIPSTKHEDEPTDKYDESRRY